MSNTDDDMAVSGKPQLRKLMAKIIGQLSSEEIQRQSLSVINKLYKHQRFVKAKSISIYLSTSQEIQTNVIVERLLGSNNGADRKRCFIPYVRKLQRKHSPYFDTRMIMLELENLGQFNSLPTNKFGIKEHELNERNENWASQLKFANPLKSELDLVIVPGVAFTRTNQRCGHGKGYYDEFLSNWQNKSSRKLHTIGVALTEQIVDDVFAIEGHDYVLDEVLTP